VYLDLLSGIIDGDVWPMSGFYFLVALNVSTGLIIVGMLTIPSDLRLVSVHSQSGLYIVVLL
jgi:hypothetical protein